MEVKTKYEIWDKLYALNGTEIELFIVGKINIYFFYESNEFIKNEKEKIFKISYEKKDEDYPYYYEKDLFKTKKELKDYLLNS